MATGSSLHAAALACLRSADPCDKIAATDDAAARWRAGELSLDAPAPAVQAIPLPGRPQRPRLVHPRELAQRGLGTPEGRAALIHAVAHIELNAIDLAWDAVYRFRDMPRAFYDDWIGVAVDEARHFALLSARLADYGHVYGDFDAHNGLWDMAVRTADACIARMALVPRVLEARGLDVTPGMIARLRECGDHETAAILGIILDEEVAHVAAGSRWFAWCCAREGVAPWPTFARLVREHAAALLRPPFNREARLRAGFSEEELAMLVPTR